MAQAALAAKAVSAVAGGLGALGAAKGERLRANINSYISDTRAIQAGTTAAEQTNAELATMRATFAANGQGIDGGSMPFIRELSRVRSRESRIAQGNEKQTGRDQRMQGRNAMARGRSQFISSALGSARPLYDIYQLRQ